MLDDKIKSIYGVQYGMIVKTANHFSHTVVCRDADYVKHFSTKIEDTVMSNGVVAYTTNTEGIRKWVINNSSHMRLFGYIKEDEASEFEDVRELFDALESYLKRASYCMRYIGEKRTDIFMQLFILLRYNSPKFCNKLHHDPIFGIEDIIKISQILNSDESLNAEVLKDVLQLPNLFLEELYSIKIKATLTSFYL